MNRIVPGLCLLALAAAASAAQQPAPQSAAPRPPAPVSAVTPLPADQAAMRAHVLFLASDALKGREAGSPEFDVAAEYVAAQFSAAGLRPGAGAGYLQRVPLVRFRPADRGSLTWTPAGGRARALVFGTDYLPAADPREPATRVSAPVVFVGAGVSAPSLGRDDYAGLDVRGKVVAMLASAPAGLGNGEVDASFTRDARLVEAQRRGAVGAVAVADVGGGRGPGFAASVRRWDRAAMTWAKPDGTGGGSAARGVPLLATLSPAGAAKLFGARWAAVTAAAATAQPRYAPFAAEGTLAAAVRTVLEPGQSSNVVGVIPGTDPKLGREVVVLSAHLDHIGVSPDTPENRGKDRINNGALDNAVGIASLIEEARRFAASGKPPKRTVLFLAVTGEEKGLVGADYFANNPTVPVGDLVADVNLDMPVLLYRFEDMTVFGAERSTLGPIVRRAVRSAGVDLTPDQNPEEAFFVRSDHYRFVEKGVPSVFLWPGQKGPQGAAFQTFLKTCYHRPCDEVTQPILWDQGVRFVDVNYRIAREVADADERPVWNRGDYFGALFGGPMAAR